MKVWSQIELFYNYCWGMDDFAKTEPYLEEFHPDEKVRLILDTYDYEYSPWKRFLKNFVAYLYVFGMVII